jgi:hypothetical protein
MIKPTQSTTTTKEKLYHMAERSPALAIFCFSEFGQNWGEIVSAGLDVMMKQFSQ